MMCPQGLTKRILTQVLLQVLNVRQATRWMIQLGRQHDELLDYIAAQNDFPSHEQIVANIDEASFGHTVTLGRNFGNTRTTSTHTCQGMWAMYQLTSAITIQLPRQWRYIDRHAVTVEIHSKGRA